ncbi:MAG: hypothetical protein GXY81_00855 [Candidatus Cloacimonetes bacterium]|nr:hypothetical protein [Candidatus Cloacimonadota bacterium]
MNHFNDELELGKLIRESLQANLDGEFSSHREFPYFFTRESFPALSETADLPLFPSQIPEVFLNWAGLDQAFDAQELLVLDLETTGLGRSQTLAFLIGLGYFEQGKYVVEQIFLPEPEAEASSFDRLRQLLEEKSLLITFNGKSFDIPILESRLLYHHLWLDLRSKDHIDILHLARRLWKNKTPSCALETLEYYILGQIRNLGEDIPGGLIPQTWFQFLMTGDTRMMRRVFQHNRLDILHTAALMALICNSIGYPPAKGFDHRIDYHALAKLYLSQGNQHTAKHILQDLLDTELLTADAACELGMILKKEGELNAAQARFTQAANLDSPTARLELAKLLEKRKAFAPALEQTEKLLYWHLSRPLVNEAQIEKLEHRKQRLLKKLQALKTPE